MKFLILDKNQDAYKNIVTLLQHLEHQIYNATSSSKGFGLIQTKKPDLVFCDAIDPTIGAQQLYHHLNSTLVSHRSIFIPVIPEQYSDSVETVTKQFPTGFHLVHPVNLESFFKICQRIFPPQFTKNKLEEGLRHMMKANIVAAKKTPARPPTPVAFIDSGQITVEFGELDKVPIGAVLHLIIQNKETGILTVKSGRSEKNFFIESGQIIYGRSNVPGERLDRYLSQINRISMQQVRRIEKLFRQSNRLKRIDQLMVEQKILTLEEVSLALKEYLERMSIDVFTWDEGNYKFVNSEHPKREKIKADVNMTHVLIEGTRLVKDKSILRKYLPSPRYVPVLTVPPESTIDNLTLSDAEKDILRKMDGQRNIVEVLKGSGLSQYDGEGFFFAILASCTAILQTEKSAVGTTIAQSPAGSGEAVQSESQHISSPSLQIPLKINSEYRHLYRAGTLEKKPLPKLLFELAMMKADGALEINQGKISKRIFFKMGKCILAASNDPRNRLGELLVSEGQITQEKLKEALEIRKTTQEHRLGDILYTMGAMNLGDLHTYVNRQMELIIYSCFAWVSGQYTFYPTVLPNNEPILLDFKAEDLILKGLRTIDDVKPLVSKYLKTSMPYRATKSGKSAIFQIACTMPERHLFRLMNEPITIPDLVDQSKMNKYEINRFMLALLMLEIIEPVPGAKVSRKQKKSKSADGLSEEMEQRKEEILTLYENLKTISFYDLLNVSQEFSKDELRRAHRVLLKKYHPDILQSKGLGDYIDQINAIISKINEAYFTLSEPGRRHTYDKTI